MDSVILRKNIRENIANENFDEAGQNIIRQVRHEFDNESVRSPHQLSDSERRIAELERMNAELIVKNTELARKCEDIDWYKWLGQHLTGLSIKAAGAWGMDGVQELATNKSFIQFATKVLQPLPEIVNLQLLGAISASVLCILSVYWLYKTEKKKLKVKAFINGVYTELTHWTTEMGHSTDYLFKRFLAFIEDLALKFNKGQEQSITM